MKVAVIQHYSHGTMACANPFGQHAEPYTDMRALTIDHVNGGGRRHMRSIGNLGGAPFYSWLKQQRFPSGYQVLCANCQFIKKVVMHEFRGVK